MTTSPSPPSGGASGHSNQVAVPRRSTGEHVADALREMVLSGDYPPGSLLREIALSERFDVSRRTVREAFGILEREGLVRHQPHKRTTVAQLEEQDVRDLYRVRLTLECAAATVDPVSEDALRDVAQAFDALVAATTSGAARDVVEKDLLFHRSVVALLGSSRINAFWRTVESEMRFALVILECHERESVVRPNQALAEHRAIHTALQRRDGETASRLLGAHAAQNEALLLGILRRPAAD